MPPMWPWFAGDSVVVSIVPRPIAGLSLSRRSEANGTGSAAVGKRCDVSQRRHWRPGAQAQEDPTKCESNQCGQRCDLAQAIPSAQLGGAVEAGRYRAKAAL